MGTFARWALLDLPFVAWSESVVGWPALTARSPVPRGWKRWRGTRRSADAECPVLPNRLHISTRREHSDDGSGLAQRSLGLSDRRAFPGGTVVGRPVREAVYHDARLARERSSTPALVALQAVAEAKAVAERRVGAGVTEAVLRQGEISGSDDQPPQCLATPARHVRRDVSRLTQIERASASNEAVASQDHTSMWPMPRSASSRGDSPGHGA